MQTPPRDTAGDADTELAIEIEAEGSAPAPPHTPLTLTRTNMPGTPSTNKSVLPGKMSVRENTYI